MKPEKHPKISLADLTDEEAIFRAIRNKCLQSPFTVIPLALAAGILLLTGSFGLGFLGVFASAVLAIIGSAAFVYHLWIRGESLARDHVRGMMEQLKQDRRQALSEVAAMCREIGFPEGEKEANELSEAYQQYTGFLETRAGSKLGSAVGERMALAESARQAGVGHLRQAAEIHIALGGVAITALRAEHTRWSEEASEKRGQDPILESKISAHDQQISRYGQLVLKRDELIARSNELEAAIKNAYMSEAGKSGFDIEKNSDNPATRLLNAVSAAEAAELNMRTFLEDAGTERPVTD